MYLNTIQIIGFVGKDPARYHVQGSDAAYTVFSVATQRSWKDAQGAWQSRTDWHRVVAGSRLGDFAARLCSGDHVHVQGQLVSRTYDKQFGSDNNPAVVKQTLWQIRAGSIRKLNRVNSQSAPSAAPATATAPDNSEAVPF